MKLLVGLGNPGPQYETTRHNAGFLILDLIAEAAQVNFEGGSNSRFVGELGKGQVLGESCVLLKPMTFMNRSGRSVGEAMRFFKVAAADTIVFYDDIDVPAGKVRAREGGGHGGHNGVRSIIDETGESAFHRIKLGVGRPTALTDSPSREQKAREEAVHNWVLGRMTETELLVLQEDMLAEAMLRLKQIFGNKSRGSDK